MGLELQSRGNFELPKISPFVTYNHLYFLEHWAAHFLASDLCQKLTFLLLSSGSTHLFKQVLCPEPLHFPLIRTIMESKEALYRPLMSQDKARDSVTDEINSSSDESLSEIYESRGRWQRWVPRLILGSIIILILLIIGLIIAILVHKPTDLQCSKQLSMYCGFCRVSPVFACLKGR